MISFFLAVVIQLLMCHYVTPEEMQFYDAELPKHQRLTIIPILLLHDDELKSLEVIANNGEMYITAAIKRMKRLVECEESLSDISALGETPDGVKDLMDAAEKIIDETEDCSKIKKKLEKLWSSKMSPDPFYLRHFFRYTQIGYEAAVFYSINNDVERNENHQYHMCPSSYYMIKPANCKKQSHPMTTEFTDETLWDEVIRGRFKLYYPPRCVHKLFKLHRPKGIKSTDTFQYFYKTSTQTAYIVFYLSADVAAQCARKNIITSFMDQVNGEEPDENEGREPESLEGSDDEGFDDVDPPPNLVITNKAVQRKNTYFNEEKDLLKIMQMECCISGTNQYVLCFNQIWSLQKRSVDERPKDLKPNLMDFNKEDGSILDPQEKAKSPCCTIC